jgi:hypothetical protein
VSRSLLQPDWPLEREGLDAATRDLELRDRIGRRVRALLRLAESMRARLADGQRSHTPMDFEDRHRASALLGLFGVKHG